MTESLLIQKAIEEIEAKTFGSTQQLLSVHEVEYVEGKPKLLRVAKEDDEGSAIAYFAIKDEKFYLAIYLDIVPEVSVRSVETAPYHAVYFRAVSKVQSFEALASLTILKPTGGWSIGDNKKKGNAVYNFTSFPIEPDTGPGQFDNKLMHLLDYLEQDKDGVLRLAENADGHIQVASIFHNGNGMLGGHHLDKDILKRLAALNLAIDFDIYAEGELFRD